MEKMNFEQSKLLDTLPKQFFANLVAKVNKKISEGVDVINLGQGNPDKPTPDYIVKSTQKWGQSFRAENEPPGILETDKAVRESSRN